MGGLTLLFIQIAPSFAKKKNELDVFSPFLPLPPNTITEKFKSFSYSSPKYLHIPCAIREHKADGGRVGCLGKVLLAQTYPWGPDGIRRMKLKLGLLGNKYLSLPVNVFTMKFCFMVQ